MHDLRAVKVLVLAGLAMVLLLTTNFSTAAFTSSSSNRGTVRAASDWTRPTVSLVGLASMLKGDIVLNASANDGESGITSVSVERRRTGAVTWAPVCVMTASPYSCTWRTAGPDDGTYEVRATAVDGAGYTEVSTTATITVDNTAPTVSLKDPGTPLSGTRLLEAVNVTDATSGVARVDLQYALGTGAWKTLCTVLAPATAWSCSVDTTTLANGTYSFRAVATDAAGHSTTSATVTGREVRNAVAPTVTLQSPGAVLAGTVALTATATAPAGIASVRVQYAPAGTTAWTDICTGTTSPLTCSWTTTTLADGYYDLRASVVDRSAVTVHSAVASARYVGNAPLLAADVQTANRAGGTAGLIEENDSITFTYSAALNPASLVPGWDGAAARPVTVRLRDGEEIGLGSQDDTLDVLLPDRSTVRLGSVHLGASLIKTNNNNKSLEAAGSMSISADRRTVTIVLGALTSGTNGNLTAVGSPGTLTWSPCTVGLPCSAPAVKEQGAPDVDF